MSGESGLVCKQALTLISLYSIWMFNSLLSSGCTVSTEYTPFVYVNTDHSHEDHFGLFGVRPLNMLLSQTILNSASHRLVHLDDPLTGRHYLLGYHVDNLVLVDVEQALFLGIYFTVLQ
ncbi:hypothetical protein TNCV_3018931 [Trichonephila clavipes]|nr:hypothetical protein TNCV_3018931 [Trichonephila clavipes]